MLQLYSNTAKQHPLSPLCQDPNPSTVTNHLKKSARRVFAMNADGVVADLNRSGSISSTILCSAPRNSLCAGYSHTVDSRSLPVPWLDVNPRRKRRHSVGGHRSISIASGAVRFADKPDLFARTLSEKLTTPWIEQVFQKRECIKFVPEENTDRCGCGRPNAAHSQAALSRFTTSMIKTGADEHRWSIREHTLASRTDAFGTIEFQGGTHAHKAQYVRLGYDSAPEDIMYLMEKVWNLERPRLVITVHGGMNNFEVQDRLGRLFREGLLKAAQTTGAWIITSGVDSGVVRHVAQALDEAGISARMRSKIVTIGIAPWGLVKRRERFIGKDIVVPYDHHSFSSRNRYAILNDRHSYFLLVDNGTVGRYGADIILRKRFEDYIAQKESLSCLARRVPIVCAVLEGGTCTIKAILQYLSSDPPVPVIVCDGSGRASDLLSFADKCVRTHGSLTDEVRAELLSLIGNLFRYSVEPAEQILDDILKCIEFKDLLTVYRLGEEKDKDVDHAILSALLRGQNLTPIDQLSLTLAWNRVDIARSDIFGAAHSVHDWPPHSLHNAMMDALLLDRVDFVQLLLENGVSLRKFLTIERLEQLYNSSYGTLSTLHHMLGDQINKNARSITLPEIGAVVEKLMGNAYRCAYTSRSFKSRYEKIRGKSQLRKIGSFHKRLTSNKIGGDKLCSKRKYGLRRPKDLSESESDFKYPFNDLMLWAVLTRRHQMAKCFWQHGEEATAKALVAIRLYKCMSQQAANDYLEMEVSNELRQYAEEFRCLSLELLDNCYQQDDGSTMRLLTAELPNWGHHTCLSLAVIGNHKQFLAHPCCQILLAELWHGGLRIRSQSNLKVIVAILFPPSILLLNFKTPTLTEGRELKEREEGSDSEDSELSYEEKEHPDHHTLMVAKQINSLLKSRRAIANKLRSSSKHNGECADLMNDVEAQKKSSFPSEPRSRVSSHHSRHHSRTYQSMCSAWNKLYIFYKAPITSFWVWSLSFAVFLFSFIYVVLIESPEQPSNIEWFLCAYVTCIGLEHFRKLITLESSSFLEKVRVFFNRYWNILTAVAVLTFFIGFAFRCQLSTRHTYGRVTLACNSVLWHMKLLDFLSVHPKIGPYITMAAKMVLNMSYIIVILLVTLMAFGVAKQSITYPHEKWSWLLVRNIFYKPYFMLYGEVYAGEIDTCGDEGVNCVPGGWIPPILMTIFLLVANILLINMLIAIFNHIFNETNAMSQQVWLFQRYQQVMEYENTPVVPPPFIILIHMYMLGQFLTTCAQRRKYSIHRKKNCKSVLDFAIKVHLDEDELRQLHDFEEDCMDDLSRKKQHIRTIDTEQRIHRTAESTETIAMKMSDVVNENCIMKTQMCDLETRLDSIERSQQRILDMLTALVGKEPVDTRKPSVPSTHPEKVDRPRIVVEPLREPRHDAPPHSPDATVRLSRVDSFPSASSSACRSRKASYTSITDHILLRNLSAMRNLSPSPSAKSSIVAFGLPPAVDSVGTDDDDGDEHLDFACSQRSRQASMTISADLNQMRSDFDLSAHERFVAPSEQGSLQSSEEDDSTERENV
ncbi:hypothetical protein QR680_007566 [Steinernema hermaphroditum]|uniref:TRPM SLOG domain-containing protein n=1 Tax=Steinernema hermaphroditum TaxID=289476 RepID=A0AA39IF53_9BILA|nr:hypothetical protein QR680_007566 [Steinernema hermaphroditum]